MTAGEAASEAKSRPLEEETVRRQLSKLGGTGFCWESLDIFVEPGVFLPMGALNDLRRRAVEEIQEACCRAYQRTI